MTAMGVRFQLVRFGIAPWARPWPAPVGGARRPGKVRFLLGTYKYLACFR